MRRIKSYNIIVLYLLFVSLSIQPAWTMQSSGTCTYEIKGTILDLETKKPVPYATVTIKGSKLGTVANENGEFKLERLCTKENTLIVSSVGYQAIAHHHDEYHETPKIYIAASSSELAGVVVEGEAIVGDLKSLSLEKISKADLSSKTTTSLASAISDVQGVTFTSVGTNVQLPVIHGLHGNRILVLNNGVKHAFQNWGDEHAPEIDVASANNISVLKGAAGVRYGPEALGGAVIIEGDPLDLDEDFNGSIATGYQTNGRGYHINANAGQGFERFSYNLGGKYQRIGDRQAPDYSLTNTGIIESSFNAGFKYHLPSWDFKVYYSYVQQELGLLRASVTANLEAFNRSINADRPIFIRDFSYDINEPSQSTAHHLANFSADWYSDIGTFKLLLSQQFNRREEFDVRRNAERPIIFLDLSTTDTRLEWYHPEVGGLEGIVGVQYFYQNNDNSTQFTQTTAFIPNYNTNRVSLFAIESLQKGNSTFEFGLRLDHEATSARGRTTAQELFSNEYEFTNFTASLGLVREISPQWQWRTNIGSAWRTPTVAELYAFGQQGFRAQFGLWRFTFREGNLDTTEIFTEDNGPSAPEKGYKWINEFTYTGEKSSLTLTAYSHYIENYLFDRPVGVTGSFRGPLPVFFIDQVDAAFIGADVTYAYSFSDNFQGKFGGSYLWSQNIEDNQPLIDQPPINLSAEFKWKTSTFDWFKSSNLSLTTSYTFRQFQAPRVVTPNQITSGEVQITENSEIFDFSEAPDGYFLANLLWDWSKGKLGGQIEIRNLLNTSYRDYLNQFRYFADEPGRNILLTLNYTF